MFLISNSLFGLYGYGATPPHLSYMELTLNLTFLDSYGLFQSYPLAGYCDTLQMSKFKVLNSVITQLSCDHKPDIEFLSSDFNILSTFLSNLD